MTHFETVGMEALELAALDPAAARVLAGSVIDSARQHRAWGAVAVTERALGVAAMTLNDIDAAVAHLRAAVAAGQRTRVPRITGEARMSLASALTLQGVPAQASRQIVQAVRELDGVARARAHVQHAAILQELGRPQEALDELRRGLPALRRADDAEWLVRALSNRSLLHVGRRAFSAAEADLEAALRLCEAHQLGLPAAYAEHNLGFVKAQRGDVPGALRLFDEAAERYRAFGLLEPGLMLDRAGVLLSVRLLDEARRSLEDAMRLYREDNRAVHAPEAELMLSTVALLQGDYRTAADSAAGAVQGYRRLRHAQSLALARYAGAQAALQLDAAAVTSGRLARLADQLDAAGWTVPALEARVLAGRVALRDGQLAAARRHLARASRARSIGPADARARAWFAEAVLRQSLGRRPAAYTALRCGLRIVEEYQATLGATELRAHVSVHRGSLARMGLQLAIEDGNARQAYWWAERGRGIALLLRAAEPSPDPQLAQDLADLRSTMAEIEERRLDERADDAKLLRRQVALEHRIRNRCRSLQGDGHAVTSPEPVRDVAGLLGGSALVEYVELEQRLHAITIIDRRVRLHDLGAASEVTGCVRVLHFALRRLASARWGRRDRTASARESLRLAAERLDHLLLEPLGRHLENRPLVIVPAEALQSLPWSVLPSCAGRPVTVSPSATHWARAVARQGPSTPRTLVVAGPDLPGAAAEGHVIAGLYREATLLEGAAATTGATLAAMEGATMLHLSCHGRLRADNPLFSSLLLADGQLTVYELERLQRPAHHVVLAGCDTAKVQVVAGQELLGMAAALLAAGTSTLVASVLPLPDLATVDLMRVYHEALLRGRRPAAALAEAQAGTDEDDPAAVVAAAGFVCMGAG